MTATVDTTTPTVPGPGEGARSLLALRDRLYPHQSLTGSDRAQLREVLEQLDAALALCEQSEIECAHWSHGERVAYQAALLRVLSKHVSQPLTAVPLAGGW